MTVHPLEVGDCAGGGGGGEVEASWAQKQDSHKANTCCDIPLFDNSDV